MMLITYTLIEYSRLHAMTIMSPSTCSQALSKGISLHAVTFMLREVDLPVMLIVDLSLARVVQHSPFQFHAYAYTVEVFSLCHSDGACVHTHDDHYLTRSNFNSYTSGTLRT